jgi:hypothetical protein
VGGGYGNPSRAVTAIGVWTKVCNHSPRTKKRRGHYRLGGDLFNAWVTRELRKLGRTGPRSKRTRRC